jgi:hypothetical protein
MPNKDLYRLDGKLQLLSAEEAGARARPASLVRITKRTVGAELPLHLPQPRVGRELRPGDVIVIERHRAAAYRDVAERFPPGTDAAAVEALLRLPDLEPAISAYLTQTLEPSDSDKAEKETADAEGQAAPRRKRTKSST